MNDKEKKIKAEITKLSKILDGVPENKKKLCDSTIKNAAFMIVTLEELQEKINEDGAVFTSVNGNGFEITQEHPAQKSYINLMSKYLSAMNILLTLLPDAKQEGINVAGENLAAFVAKGKKIELR